MKDILQQSIKGCTSCNEAWQAFQHTCSAQSTGISIKPQNFIK